MAKGKKTGGRQRGSRNKATIARELRAQSGIRNAQQSGELPLNVILRRMRGEGPSVSDEQFQAAVAAAPFMHPRLAAVAVNSPSAAPPVDEDRRRALRQALLRELADLAKPTLLTVDEMGREA